MVFPKESPLLILLSIHEIADATRLLRHTWRFVKVKVQTDQGRKTKLADWQFVIQRLR